VRIYTVALPEEFDELSKQIEDISIEKNQTISWTIRDILCEAMSFTPVFEREIVKRNKYSFKNRSRKA